jgi:hypothetical protein
MPKTIINYQKAVIYKIEHLEQPELLYVGSTTEFIKRKCKHKSCCNNEKDKYYNLKLYKMIRNNGGWDCFKIMVVKEYPCLNKIELLIEEDKQMKELKSSLNQMKAHRTDEELKEQKKEYYEAKKEIIKEQAKEYYEANKEKKKEYQEANKTKIKEYKEANKTKIKEQQKERYQKRKHKNNST